MQATQQTATFCFWPQRIWFGAITLVFAGIHVGYAIRPEDAYGGVIGRSGQPIDWWVRPAFLLIALGLVLLLGGTARARVVFKGDQLIIHNPRRTVRVLLAEVERFGVGRHGWTGSRCGEAVLRDGRVLAMHGVAGPNESTFPRWKPIERNVDRMNAYLAQIRRTSTAVDDGSPSTVDQPAPATSA